MGVSVLISSPGNIMEPCLLCVLHVRKRHTDYNSSSSRASQPSAMKLEAHNFSETSGLF